jgi:fructuronate reductase/mannitol 2-dehydrogenase
MADPAVSAFIEAMLLEEIAPLLPATGSLDPRDYVATTVERFANPAMGDALARLCRRGSVKMPSYLLPSLRDAAERGTSRDRLVLAVAAWMLYLRGKSLSGSALDVDDPQARRLTDLARQGGDDPTPLLGADDIFGDLGDDPAVVADLRAALRRLSQDGAAALTVESRPRPLVA